MNLSHSLHSSCLEVFGHKEERRGEGAPSPPLMSPSRVPLLSCAQIPPSTCYAGYLSHVAQDFDFTYFTALIISQLASPVFGPF